MNKTLVYFHGGACSKMDIAGIYERPEFKDFEILAPDFPGCGSAPYKETSVSLMDIVETMEAFLSKVEMPVIVGHSMGGLVGLLYAERNPVSAFVNVEGNLTLDNCKFSSKVVRQNREEFLSAGASAMLATLEATENLGFLNWAHTIRNWSDMGAFYDTCIELMKYAKEGDILERYKILNCPKVYIYGDANRQLPFLDKIENLEISESDHFPMIDNPEEFYTKLAVFLQSIKMVS